MWYLSVGETISMAKLFVFRLLDDILVLQKCKGVIGLLQYQVLPYEWKENCGASLSARATLNKRETSPDRYAYDLTPPMFSSPTLRNRIQKNHQISVFASS